VAVGEAIVYAAVPTEDCECPDEVAIAFTVCVELTVSAPVYRVDEVVGVDPFVV
jgi:hypothetical protein